jgi:hypothetical protein
VHPDVEQILNPQHSNQHHKLNAIKKQPTSAQQLQQLLGRGRGADPGEKRNNIQTWIRSWGEEKLGEKEKRRGESEEKRRRERRTYKRTTTTAFTSLPTSLCRLT